MALLVAGNVVRITVLGAASGQAVVNQFHYHASTAGMTTLDQQDGLAAFLDAFRDLWRVNAIPLLNTTYQVGEYRADAYSFRFADGANPGKFRPNVSDIQTILGEVGPDTGSKVGVPTPTYEALGISFRAMPQQWPTRSSNRIGPVVEADSNVNAVVGVTKTALLALANALKASLVARDGTAFLTRVSWSTKRLTTHPEPTTWPTSFLSPIISANINSFITTQVSRKERAPKAG